MNKILVYFAKYNFLEVVTLPSIVTRRMQNFQVTIPKNFFISGYWYPDVLVALLVSLTIAGYQYLEVAKPLGYDTWKLYNLRVSLPGSYRASE